VNDRYKRYYKNGKNWFEKNVVIKDLYKEWDENGQLRYETNYKDGVRID
tara:strand:- start:427 stop:573 length:147 start_codon:yes stop_codon:yes gene_type:complete